MSELDESAASNADQNSVRRVTVGGGVEQTSGLSSIVRRRLLR